MTSWLQIEGPDSDVVLSTRIRLARNVADIPFPHMMNEQQSDQILSISQEVTKELNKYGHFGTLKFIVLNQLSPIERQVLVERHIISPAHAQGPRGSALIIADDESVSIMVNEEDHFRIQCLASGLQLETALENSGKIDDVMQTKVNYAFDQKLGYLTACPTNVGTGLRASVMVHLPALAMTHQSKGVLSTVARLGFAVRGLYGEGSEVIGNIYQISNQITLGRSEADIVKNLKAVAMQVIERERMARDSLLKNRRLQLEDLIGRSYGSLTNARIVSSQEAFKLLSDVRLGVYLGLVKNLTPQVTNELLVTIMPAHLQKLSGSELSPFERDIRRASLIREKLR